MNREEILERILSAGSDHLEVFGGRFRGGYMLQQNPAELTEFIFEHQHRKIRRYMEIGAAACGLARFMNDIFQFEKITLVDLGVHSAIPKARTQNLANMNTQVVLLEGDSHSPEIEQKLGNDLFDLIVVDGDHTYEGAKADCLLAIRRLNAGGLLFLHDTLVFSDGSVIEPCGVPQLAQEMGTHWMGLTRLRDYQATGPQAKGIALFERSV